jgi:hypothetical protein
MFTARYGLSPYITRILFVLQRRNFQVLAKYFECFPRTKNIGLFSPETLLQRKMTQDVISTCHVASPYLWAVTWVVLPVYFTRTVGSYSDNVMSITDHCDTSSNTSDLYSARPQFKTRLGQQPTWPTFVVVLPSPSRQILVTFLSDER